MWRYFSALTCLFTISLCEDFAFWDYCEEITTSCVLPLGTARYAYASGFDSDSSTWYLMGGTIGNGVSFVTTDTVAKVSVPQKEYTLLNSWSGCSSSYERVLPQPLGQSVGAVVGDNLYNFGGFDNNFEYIEDTYYSNITMKSSFGSLADMPSPTSAACTVTVGTKVYIMGGLTTNSTVTDAVFMYNTVDNSWTTLQPMNRARFAPACAYYNGKIYVFAGQSAGFGPDYNSTEIYDIDSNTWTDSDAQLSNTSHWLSAAYINVADRNLAIIMGGSEGWPVAVRDNLDVYDMDLDEIILRTNLLRPRYAFNAITLSHLDFGSRLVLMAGGKNQENEAVGAINAISCSEPTASPTTEDEAQDQSEGSMKKAGFMFMFMIVSFFVIL